MLGWAAGRSESHQEPSGAALGLCPVPTHCWALCVALSGAGAALCYPGAIPVLALGWLWLALCGATLPILLWVLRVLWALLGGTVLTLCRALCWVPGARWVSTGLSSVLSSGLSLDYLLNIYRFYWYRLSECLPLLLVDNLFYR